ncbi:MAG TPA: hypothetical protein VKX49_24690 [Bryobacteraceae bacterium]|nr:hypothetical protein [Bryobacteraceae bacterium]
MRILAAILLGIFSILSVACVDGGVMLQPSQQGEWSNFQNKTHQQTHGPIAPVEKPSAEK